MQKEIIYTASTGSACGIVGTATQTNETLQTISLIITIVGTIFSFIIVPLVSWYLNAKKDGKIDKEELQEGIKIISDGVDKVKEEKDNAKSGTNIK